MGQNTSLAVVAGNPAISYYYAANYDPRYSFESASDGSGIWLTYTRGSQSVNEIWFTVPWSETLDGLDWNYDDTTKQILSDNGTQQVNKATPH